MEERKENIVHCKEREEDRAPEPSAHIIAAGGVLPPVILLTCLAQVCSEKLRVSNGSCIDQHLSALVS